MPVVKKRKNKSTKPRAKKSKAAKKPRKKKAPRKKSRRKTAKKRKPRKQKHSNVVKHSNVLGGLVCVNQKQPYDCVVACLAMFLDKPYEYVKDKYFSSHDFSYSGQGITKEKEIKVLTAEGYNVADISPILPGRKAIVTVPSLNYPDSYHAVFWDGITICDPNSGKKKKDKKVKTYTHETFLNEPYKQPIIAVV